MILDIDMGRLLPSGFSRAALFVSALWLLTHAFFLSWGLPNPVSFGGDTVPPQLDARASDHMRRNFFAYPPMQYLVYDAVFPKVSEAGMDDPWKLAGLRSVRMAEMRLLVALMGLVSALAIAFAVQKVCGSALGAGAAGAFYLLSPEILYRSLTTHMDQPYIFWWTLCLLFALLSFLRRERDMKGRLLDVLAGACLGLSAATKDQIYAACALPGLTVLAVLWREKGWRRSVETAALWGLSSFGAWASAWALLGGGLEPLTAHLDILTGKTSLDNVASGAVPGLGGILKLALLDAWQFIRMLDWPLALVLVSSIAWLSLSGRSGGSPSQEGEGLSKTRSLLAVSLCLAFIAALSIEILFFQIVRLSQPRYWLGVLPFACFAGGVAFSALPAAPKLFKMALALPVLLLLASSFQYLYSMKFESRLALRGEVRRLEASRAPGGIVGVQGLDFRTFGGVTNLCDWSMPITGLLSGRQRPLLLSPLFLALLEPDIVVAVSDDASYGQRERLLKTSGYELLSEVKPPAGPIPSLNAYESPSFAVFGRRPDAKVPESAVKAELAAMDLNRQLLVFRNCVLPEALERQLDLAGRLLAAFDGYDAERYPVVPSAIAFAALAYERAGRLEDAAKAHLLCLRNLGYEEVLRRDALRFFSANPALAERFKVRLKPPGSANAEGARK